MSRRAWWIVGFLTVTAVAVGAELVAAFDSSPDTVPWTDLLGEYVPWPVTAAAVALLVAWLPVHLYRRYHRSKETTVPNLLPLPPSTADDARNRAWRTFAQGLISDVLIAATGTLIAAITAPDFVMSRGYVAAVGVLVGKSVVVAVLSYVARYARPPAV